MVDMYSQILSRMTDAFSSIISNNQNRVMKFLAAITIIIAVPTVIASFFGMNVPVPMAEFSYGFIAVILIAFIASCIAAYFFWKNQMF